VEFWEQTGSIFKGFWNTTEIEVKLAMCLASIQEISDSIPQALLFIHAICPEIIPFLDNTQTPETQNVYITQNVNLNKTTNLIIGIMEKLAVSKENDAEFSSKSVKENLSNSSIIDSTFAADSLLVIRSCILLEFCSGIVVIWSNQELEAAGVAE